MDLTLADLEELEVPLGFLYSLSKMKGGYSNENYLLTASSGMYRIRVSKFTRDLENITAEQKVLNWVTNASRLPIPLLFVFTLPNDIHISIFPYIHSDPVFNLKNERLIRNIGKALAEYHRAAQGYEGPLPSSFNFPFFDLDSLYKQMINHSYMDNPDFIPAIESLYSRIRRASEQLNEQQYTSLPHLACHGDYAPANVLSIEDKVAGIIDFECCHWAPRVYDVATALLALQQNEVYEEPMLSWFMEGYQTNISLSGEELELIPEFQTIRSLYSANKHFLMAIKGKMGINGDLVMYWSRITFKQPKR